MIHFRHKKETKVLLTALPKRYNKIRGFKRMPSVRTYSTKSSKRKISLCRLGRGKNFCHYLVHALETFWRFILEPQFYHISLLSTLYSWLAKGWNYYVSLLCKGMYGYEYLLKEVAMALHTKVRDNKVYVIFSRIMIRISQMGSHLHTDLYLLMIFR
jgi:hypothetical protein